LEESLNGDAVSTDGPKVTIYLGTTFGGALVGYKLPAEHNKPIEKGRP
jgi:hypothetical protein